MIKYEAEQFAAKIKWSFDSILPNLPVPGTESFVILIKEFRPYGLTPGSVSLQTPTNNLGDVRLDINLPRYKISISFNYDSLEIVINDLLYEDVPVFFEIMKSAFSVLTHISKSAEQGNGTTSISAHLRLIDDRIEDLNAKMIVRDGQMKFVRPDALAFRIELDEVTTKAESSIVLAKSVKYENSLFTELTYNFKAEDSENIIEFHQTIAEHYKLVLGIFDLHEQSDAS